MSLDDAIRALREQSQGPAPEARATRARVVAALERKRGRRSRRAFVVLPIAAVLAAATASAAGTGRLPAAWHSALEVLRLSTAPRDAPSPSVSPSPSPSP